MLCRRCRKEEAVIRIPYSREYLCRSCFISFFDTKVKRMVEDHKMFRKGDVVAVALSGGKDSASLLYSLKKLYPEIEFKAIYVNLGIAGYSMECERASKELAERVNVEFLVYDLMKEDGVNVDLFKFTLYKRKACSPCSVIKRRVFDVLAKRAGANVLATGHNLDDIVSIYLSSFFSGEFSYISNLGPVQPPLMEGMPKKVKPLIKIPEREVSLYAYYNNLPVNRTECPHSAGNVQNQYKRLIAFMEEENPGFKFQVYSLFRKKFQPLIKDERPLTRCVRCGFPSSGEVCSYCKRIEILREARRFTKHISGS